MKCCLVQTFICVFPLGHLNVCTSNGRWKDYQNEETIIVNTGNSLIFNIIQILQNKQAIFVNPC